MLTNLDLAGSLALVGILVLFVLMLLKELAVASADSRLHRLSRVLDISILPLLIAFFLVVIFKVIEVLS
jgi:hypothetical protein